MQMNWAWLAIAVGLLLVAGSAAEALYNYWRIRKGFATRRIEEDRDV